jgi:hypothetical protein
VVILHELNVNPKLGVAFKTIGFPKKSTVITVPRRRDY